MKSPTKNYTPQEVKLAYRVVTEDLFNSLLRDKNDTTIRLGTLGKLIKQESQQKCGWDQKNYVYWKLKFKPFKKLKEALNEQIIKKYRLK